MTNTAKPARVKLIVGLPLVAVLIAAAFLAVCFMLTVAAPFVAALAAGFLMAVIFKLASWVLPTARQ